jgi:putative transcriptional regulator
VRRVPRTRTLRRALGLTQEEFALRYHIPLRTLRDWEQGRCIPDQTAMAYLQVIARDPEGVSQLLKPKPRERRVAGRCEQANSCLVALFSLSG